MSLVRRLRLRIARWLAAPELGEVRRCYGHAWSLSAITLDLDMHGTPTLSLEYASPERADYDIFTEGPGT